MRTLPIPPPPSSVSAPFYGYLKLKLHRSKESRNRHWSHRRSNREPPASSSEGRALTNWAKCMTVLTPCSSLVLGFPRKGFCQTSIPILFLFYMQEENLPLLVDLQWCPVEHCKNEELWLAKTLLNNVLRTEKLNNKYCSVPRTRQLDTAYIYTFWNSIISAPTPGVFWVAMFCLTFST